MHANENTTQFQALVANYVRSGFAAKDAREEAAREIRLTTGDVYFGRSAEEVAEIDAGFDAEYQHARRTAGVCDEFPAGEFAVPGFNFDFDYEDRR